jgi:hypothetical protein
MTPSTRWKGERRSCKSSCLNRQPWAGFRLPWDCPSNL